MTYVKLLTYMYMYISYCRVVHAITSLDIQFTITRPRSCLDKDLVFLALIEATLEHCLEECSLRPKCKAVNYHWRFPLCELLEADNGDFTDNDSRTSPCVFIKRSDIIFHGHFPAGCGCLDGETCDMEQITCRIKECPKLTVTHGRLFGNMNSIGSRVKYVCHEEYVDISGGMYSTCGTDGHWTPQRNCVRDCEEPTSIAEAAITAGNTYEGQVRTYTCTSGYLFTNSMHTKTVICQPSGNWLPATGDCVIDCEEPTSVEDAAISAGNTYEGQVRTYTCTTGYLFDDGATEITITCQSIGQWSAVNSACVVDCEAPPTVADSTISAGKTYEGQLRTYTCHFGYIFDDGTTGCTISCQSNGQWSTVSSACVVDCTEPLPVAHATLSVGSTYEDKIRTYTCSPGYQLEDGTREMTTICKSTGHWSHVSSTCIECYPTGGEYTGTSSVTENNMPCLAWTLIWYTPSKFPDITIAAASNYCRDPDNSGKPWCCLNIGCDDTEHTDYEYCDIPECS